MKRKILLVKEENNFERVISLESLHFEWFYWLKRTIKLSVRTLLPAALYVPVIEYFGQLVHIHVCYCAKHTNHAVSGKENTFREPVGF